MTPHFLDLASIDCDYYTSNCHKWLFCPSAVAFFYARDRKKFDTELHHPIVSHNYGKGLWLESAWIGTRDYRQVLYLSLIIDSSTSALSNLFCSSLECVPAALEFIESIGGIQRVMEYNHNLVWTAAKKLASGWGTKIGAPEEMVGTLALVQLPLELNGKFKVGDSDELGDGL